MWIFIISYWGMTMGCRIFLSFLAIIFTYSIDAYAHQGQDAIVEGVRWHAHTHRRSGNRVLHEAFGERRLWGVRATHLDRYHQRAHRLTAFGYNHVLVTYRKSDRRRRDRRDRSAPVAVGIAHAFSTTRPHEIVIEQFDHSRSRVIDVNDVSGVLLTHSRGYGKVSFTEDMLAHLSKEWRKRFPRSENRRYRFYGRVAALFSDGWQLVEVYAVRSGRGARRHLDDRPVALISSNHLPRLPRRLPRLRQPIMGSDALLAD